MQIFAFNQETGQLSDAEGRKCLEVFQEQTEKSPFALRVTECAIKPSQKWELNDLSSKKKV